MNRRRRSWGCCRDRHGRDRRGIGRSLLLGTVLATIAVATPAWAQQWTYNVRGAVATAFTDNTNQASDEFFIDLCRDDPNNAGVPDPNDPNCFCTDDPDNEICPVAEASLSTTVTPSAVLGFETPRSVHVGTLEVSAIQFLFADAETPEPISGSLGYNALFATSRYTETGVGASAGFGAVSTAVGNAGDELQEAQPEGSTTFRSVGVNQRFRWDFAREWRVIQTAGATQVNTTNDDGDVTSSEIRARNYAVSAGLSKSWIRTNASLAGSTSFVDLLQRPGGNLECMEVSPDPDVALAECTVSKQVISNVNVGVGRDFGPSWTARTSIGVAAVTPIENTADGGVEETSFSPAGNLSVSYFRALRTVTASVTGNLGYGIAPNLRLGTINQNATGSLTGRVPLPWFRRGQTFTVTVGATVGGARSRIVSDFDAEEAAWWQAQSDLSVTWLPADTWSVSLRYQYARQLLSEDEIGLEAVVPASFSRNTVFLQVSGSWPSRPAVSIPQRTNSRVDRSDEEAIGDEGQQVGGGATQRR